MESGNELLRQFEIVYSDLQLNGKLGEYKIHSLSTCTFSSRSNYSAHRRRQLWHRVSGEIPQRGGRHQNFARVEGRYDGAAEVQIRTRKWRVVVDESDTRTFPVFN